MESLERQKSLGIHVEPSKMNPTPQQERMDSLRELHPLCSLRSHDKGYPFPPGKLEKDLVPQSGDSNIRYSYCTHHGFSMPKLQGGYLIAVQGKNVSCNPARFKNLEMTSAPLLSFKS